MSTAVHARAWLPGRHRVRARVRAWIRGCACGLVVLATLATGLWADSVPAQEQLTREDYLQQARARLLADAKVPEAQACNPLLDADVVATVVDNEIVGLRIQEGLISFYTGDALFEAARRLSKRSDDRDFLSDGALGPWSREWMAIFCMEARAWDTLGEAPSSFILRNTLELLLGYARIADSHPDWQPIPGTSNAL